MRASNPMAGRFRADGGRQGRRRQDRRQSERRRARAGAQVVGGKPREFHRIGLGASATGSSIRIFGIADQGLLSAAYGARPGKARVTGHCIMFWSLEEIALDVLEEAIRFGFEDRREGGD